MSKDYTTHDSDFFVCVSVNIKNRQVPTIMKRAHAYAFTHISIKSYNWYILAHTNIVLFVLTLQRIRPSIHQYGGKTHSFLTISGEITSIANSIVWSFNSGKNNFGKGRKIANEITLKQTVKLVDCKYIEVRKSSLNLNLMVNNRSESHNLKTYVIISDSFGGTDGLNHKALIGHTSGVTNNSTGLREVTETKSKGKIKTNHMPCHQNEGNHCSLFELFQRLWSTGMSEQLTDYSDSDEDLDETAINTSEPIDIDIEEPLDISVTDQEIAQISGSAANLGIDTKRETVPSKRNRDPDSANTSLQFIQPPKKMQKVMMPPPQAPDDPNRQELHVVRLVPDIEDVHLFSKAHGDIIHKSVLRQLKECTNHNVKFEFCRPDRGRYKFVCPNNDAKTWAMNVVGQLKELWPDPKIKAIDCGVMPKIVRASITFNNPAPEAFDFFEEVDMKNDTIDTNEWRVYGKKRQPGNKSIMYIGVDEKSVSDLKGIGFKVYFSNGRTRINIDSNTNG